MIPEKVREIPELVHFDSVFEIESKNITYFTHGFFKYPCKFIPHIPRWAILKYSAQGDFILDPFAGSGTTLVEAVIHNRNGLGIDFDELSQLLCSTKTKMLNDDQIQEVQKSLPSFFNKTTTKYEFSPDIVNLEHWFPQQNIEDLLTLRHNIFIHYETLKDQEIFNFLLVCFASIIKKCSFADDASPKPYVSSRIKKEAGNVNSLFLKTVSSNLQQFKKFSKSELASYSLIGNDARYINTTQFDNKVTLAITSPPYINAFDYVRALRLENAWLGYSGDSMNINKKQMQIGTENIPVISYAQFPEATGIDDLDKIVQDLYKEDRKRAHVVRKYFSDMFQSFKQTRRLLTNSGHFIVVVGNNNIKHIAVPTRDILIDIAQNSGFKCHSYFSYVIKNRYLRIPRSGRGGDINVDWVIDLEVTNA